MLEPETEPQSMQNILVLEARPLPRVVALRRNTGRVWELLFREPRGHRLWREVETGRISIADQSGDGLTQAKRHEIGTPDDTDDGVLWLVAPVNAEVSLHSTGPLIRLPLLEGNGASSATYVTPAFALRLVEHVPVTFVVDESLTDLAKILKRALP